MKIENNFYFYLKIEMKVFSFFQVLLLKYHLKNPILHLFHNRYENKVGILNNRGSLFKFQPNEELKKYGDISFKNLNQYEEYGKEWIINTLDQRTFYKNKWFHVDSSLLYNQYSNSSFFQVYQNKEIYKDGIYIEIDKKIYESSWEKVSIYNDRYLIIIDLNHRIFIYDFELKYICYEEEYISPSSVIDMDISFDHYFYYIYIGYDKIGIRSLLFYGGFNNPPIEKSFLPISNLKKFRTEYPYLIIHNDYSFFIYKKVRRFPFEKMKTIFFPYTIHNLLFFNQTMYTFLSNEIFLLKI